MISRKHPLVLRISQMFRVLVALPCLAQSTLSEMWRLLFGLSDRYKIELSPRSHTVAGLDFEHSVSVYQNLNGPQPKEQWRSAVYISKQA